MADNSTAQEFLVVWSSSGLLYAQRYDWQGTPLGENLLVDDSGTGYRPAVAYGPGAGCYLLVWYRTSADDSGDIYGRRVGAGGVPLGSLLILDESPGGQGSPEVATDGADFMAVWDGDANNPCFVCARGVTGGDGVDRLRPAVAHDRDTEHYLVVFEYRAAAGDLDIHGQLLSSGGGWASPELVIRDEPAGAGQT